MNLAYKNIGGEYRWVFEYMDFAKVCRKHRIHLCSCTETRFSTKTWPEADKHKAEKFVRDYRKRFFRLKDADCFNCGEQHPYPYELCSMCNVKADIQAGRLRFIENRAGNTILVPVPYQQAKAVV